MITVPNTVDKLSKDFYSYSPVLKPQLIKLGGRNSLRALHTCGTNGIMVEIAMRLAPRANYQQLIFCHPEWDLRTIS